nr:MULTISPECIES: hypothetical protein [Vibrio]
MAFSVCVGFSGYCTVR